MNWMEGHGEVSPNELIQLRRALEYGAPSPPTGGEGFGWPLVPQSLEATLAIATIQAKQIRFFQKIPKPEDFLKSPVHEFTRQVEIGYDLEPFVGEGVTPTEHASRYVRDFVRAKYLATLRRITDPMAVVQTIGGADAITRESLNGTLHLLAQLEKALFWGDASVNPQAFDGIFRTVETKFPENVFDLQGQEPTIDFLQEITAIMIRGPRYAYPEALWLAPSALAALAKQSLPNLIYLADPTNPQVYNPAQGILPRGFTGAHNQMVAYESDIFLDPEILRITSEIGTGPTQPFTVAGSAEEPEPGEKSNFRSQDAGTYRYAVAAYGATGRSSIQGFEIQVEQGQRVRITMTKEATNNNDITYYAIWRSKPGGETLYPIGRVAFEPNADITTFVDLNHEIAGTSRAVMIEYDPTIVQFRRLLPLLRIPFAKIDLSVRFAIVLFGMPIFETPSKIAVIKNIGTGA